MTMTTYPKIRNLYKRSEDGKTVTDEYAHPFFESLMDTRMLGTEKINGMNIRIMYENGLFRFGGKSDSAMIPGGLFNHLNRVVSRITDHPAPSYTLYGEGYGAGIQNGSHYSLSQEFILFDVRIGDTWLRFDDVMDIGLKLTIPTVPLIFEDSTLSYMACCVADGMKSEISNEDMEGIVVRPSYELSFSNGERVMIKLKTKDLAGKWG